MTETEQNIYDQIIKAEDKRKIVEYFFGHFNYDLPMITTIYSQEIGYKYVQTIGYIDMYNEQGILIGQPAVTETEEILPL